MNTQSTGRGSGPYASEIVLASAGRQATGLPWTETALRVTGAAALLSAFVATSTIWLMLTNPTTLAATVDGGAIAPAVRELATALVRALCGLMAYL